MTDVHFFVLLWFDAGELPVCCLQTVRFNRAKSFLTLSKIKNLTMWDFFLLRTQSREKITRLISLFIVREPRRSNAKVAFKFKPVWAITEWGPLKKHIFTTQMFFYIKFNNIWELSHNFKVLTSCLGTNCHHNENIFLHFVLLYVLRRYK